MFGQAQDATGLVGLDDELFGVFINGLFGLLLGALLLGILALRVVVVLLLLIDDLLLTSVNFGGLLLLLDIRLLL